jgi:glycosyltransferase involved in cell wall biosynthesis
MNILWVSNHPNLSSAYGQQTALFTPRLEALGHKVTIVTFSNGVPQRWKNGMLVLPSPGDAFGNDLISAHVEHHATDLVVSLVDPFVLDPNIYKQFPWCPWTPVDCRPLHPGIANIKPYVKRVWAMSRFGQDQLEEAGFDNVDYVPHGIDDKLFRPADRVEARKVLSAATGYDFSGKFIVAMVANNKGTPSRKGFYEGLKAFRHFSDDVKDAVLYLHTEMTGEVYRGEDLRQVAALVGLPAERVVFAPQYPYVLGMLTPDYLASVYNAADVFLSSSHAEGFGVPAVEAQMCGCPVILPNNTAQSELCRSGALVEAEPYMPFVALEWGRPDVDQMILRLFEALRRERTPESTSASVAEFAVDAVVERRLVPALRRASEH